MNAARLLRPWLLLVTTGMATFAARGVGADVYVSPEGSDANAGRRDSPFATVERARQAVRDMKKKQPVNVYLRAGAHYFSKTVVFTPDDLSLIHI